MNSAEEISNMSKLFCFFLIATGFSLLLHFIMGGDSSFNYQNIQISFSLTDVIIASLMLSNLLVLIFLLRKKS